MSTTRWAVTIRLSTRSFISSERSLPANFDELTREFSLEGQFITAAEVGYPRSVISTDWNNFTPRVGFAYRLNDKTVVRSGYGLFVAGTILNPFRNNLGNIFPFTIQQNFNGQNNRPNLLSLQNPTPESRLNLAGTTSASGMNQKPSQAYLQSWNFTIERQLPFGTSVEMDYRGSKGTHLLRRYDMNQPLRDQASFLGDGTFARPIPNWNAINFYNTGSNSNYHAANISWRKRSRGGLFWAR